MQYSVILYAFNWYGFIIGSGMLVAIGAAFLLSRVRGYHEDLVFWVALICIPLAVVGARLYYVIFDDNDLSYWTLKRIIGLEDGGLQGLAIYGGILAAMVGSIFVWLIYRKKENPLDRITILQMFDLFFIFIIFGQAVGRWGNFANEEAYGNLITNDKLKWFPYGVEIGNNWYQATFFYESFLNFLGCGLMFWLYFGKRKSFDGFVFSFYGIWYGFVRLFVESLRADSLMVGDVRVSQIVSILFIVAGVIIIAAHIARALISNKKIFIFVRQDRLNDAYLDFCKSRVSMPKRIYEKKSKK